MRSAYGSMGSFPAVWSMGSLSFYTLASTRHTAGTGGSTNGGEVRSRENAQTESPPIVQDKHAMACNVLKRARLNAECKKMGTHPRDEAGCNPGCGRKIWKRPFGSTQAMRRKMPLIAF